jgi:predicted NBD/HSP70 family sugar kinase
MSGDISKFYGKRPGDGIRARHRADVMRRLFDTPGIDRTRLAEAAGLTNAAMTRIVQELKQADLVRDTSLSDLAKGRKDVKARGRKRSGLEINSNGGYVLGLSILAFNSAVALADISGRVLEIVPVEPSDLSNPVTTLDELAQAALALIEKHKLDLNRVFGVGVAIAGYLDSSGSTLDSSPYLGWPVFDIKASLEERLKLNVVIDNANRCIAVAEIRTGSCTTVDDMILIRAAVGIGGAVVSGGELVQGNNNRAGQLGHSCVVPDGLLCSCGAKGCLNTVASGWAILNQLGLIESGKVEQPDLQTQEAKLRSVLSSKTKSNLAEQNAIRLAGELLARHTVGLLHSMASHTVVLTGPLGRNKTYCEGFSDTLNKYNVNIQIITAQERSITGTAEAAAVLAMSKHVYSPSFDIMPLLDSEKSTSVSAVRGLVL